MKIANKHFAIWIAITVGFFSISCTNPGEHHNAGTKQSGSHADKIVEHKLSYACPMHPEINGNEGGECSKCGMKLEPVNKDVSSKEFFMDLKASPSTIEAGKAAVLSFTPKIREKENEIIQLEEQHDKKIHLIVVSKDLSHFDHIHPKEQKNGSYNVSVLPLGTDYTNGRFEHETKFAHGGDYVLFADYLPSGKRPQLERIEVNIKGTPYTPVKFIKAQTVSTIEGFEISLHPRDGKFHSEGTNHISAILKRNGKEVTTDQLEDFLSAKAHVVLISEDTKDYVHVHPIVLNGRLGLHTEFGRSGIFRGWLQFKFQGNVHTADFVIKVEDGKSSETAHGGPGHIH